MSMLQGGQQPISHTNLLCAFFWVIPWRLYFICRRFGKLCSIFIGGYLSAYEDGTECSETSAYKIQTPGNYAEESVQHLEHTAKVWNQEYFTLIYLCYYYSLWSRETGKTNGKGKVVGSVEGEKFLQMLSDKFLGTAWNEYIRRQSKNFVILKLQC